MRLGSSKDAEEVKSHAFFSEIDWNSFSNKITEPPFKPKLNGIKDLRCFDKVSHLSTFFK